MTSEAEKLGIIRQYLSQTFPDWHIEDGSRTNVDRTLHLFQGGTFKCTVQIGMDLLLDTRRTNSELDRALRENDIVNWILSAPVAYLNNNTLKLSD